MLRIEKMLRSGFLFGTVLLGSASASAGLITQSLDFDTGTVIAQGAGGGATALIFDAFDTGQGELESVDVTVSGRLLVNVTAPLLFAPPFTSISYDFTLTAGLDFGGLDFLLDPAVIAHGFNPGADTTHIFLYEYEYSMSFTELTDALGIAAISTNDTLLANNFSASDLPPIAATNERSDFESNLPGAPFLLVPQLSISTVTTGLYPSGSAQSTGRIDLAYHFMERVQVAEPSSLALFAAGLLRLFPFAARRARAKRRVPRYSRYAASARPHEDSRRYTS